MAPDYTKDGESVEVALQVLRRLNSGRIDTFNQRMRSQKVQYLAQELGISPKYNYNLYLHGPYSPDLAKDLYALTESGEDVQTGEFLSEDMEDRLKDLRSFLAGKDVRELELLTTYHWFKEKVRLTKSQIAAKLRELKDASDEEIRAAREHMAVFA